MMQVTGNNSGNGENRILSIQLSLGGLYFSVACEGKVSSLTELKCYKQLSEAANVANALNSEPLLAQNYAKVNVILDTMEAVLLPDTVCCDEDAVNLLTVNGITITDEDAVVLSPCVKGIKAAIKYDSAVISVLEQRFPQVRFWTPLMVDITSEGNGLNVTINNKIVYITYVYNNALQYAESLSFETTEDLLYFIETVRQRFELGKGTPIYIGGLLCAEYEKEIKRNFTNLHTEVFPSQIFSENCGISNTLFNSVIKLTSENN